MEKHPIVEALLNPDTELHQFFDWKTARLTDKGVFHIDRRHGIDLGQLVSWIESKYSCQFKQAGYSNSTSLMHGSTKLNVRLYGLGTRGDLMFNPAKIISFEKALKLTAKKKKIAIPGLD